MQVFALILGAICLGVALMRKFHHPDAVKPNDPMTDQEIENFLVAAASNAPDATDWKNSIVDLLKILRTDSSFTARKTLWGEMGHAYDTYTGTAEQNVQLHTDVTDKIAKREPIVP